MAKAETLKSHLEPGKVYRRGDLKKWSNAVDRHLQELQQEGTLQKVAAGMYYYPRKTVFGLTPPSDYDLVERFLKDKRFLLTSPNDYNNLGVGTTQLYNKVVVYNNKRHGDVKLGNRVFTFWRTPYFPSSVTPEFLLVDLVNNVDNIAEDVPAVLVRVKERAVQIDQDKLKEAVQTYGNAKAKNFFASFLPVD
jgi:hypothetical protein